MTPRETWRRLLGAIGLGPRDADLAGELAFHRDMLEAQHRARGLDAETARREAALVLGGSAQIVESWRDQRGLPVVETLAQDIRYGIRVLRGSPGFTAAALVTLALGIGANTAIFTVIDAVLLRPLPYAEPDRLVTVGDRNPDGFSSNVGYATVVDWRQRSQSFAEVAVMRLWMPTLVSGTEAERLQAVRVSWNYFQTLGVSPLLGRTFLPEEDRPNDWFTVVLSEGIWRRRFAADPAIVGRTITLNDRPYRVIGVMPASFQPLDAELYYHERPQLWAALGYDPAGRASSGSCRGCQHLRAFGRLRPGVTIEAATEEMNIIRQQLRQEHPGDYETGSMAIIRLQDAVTADSRRTLWVLFGAVGFVLLIACANVANLQLARAVTRQRELTMRATLGAGRGRIVRQLLTESLLMGAGGGLAGAALAALAVRGLTRLAPGSVPRLDQIAVDGRVLAFTTVVALATGVLFGLAPAWRHAVRATRLVADHRGSSSRQSPVRALLVVANLMLALTLLTGAGLMLRTVAALAHTSPGFASDDVLAVQFSVSGSAYNDTGAVVAFEDRLLARLRGLPDVAAAALAGQLPFQGVKDCWGFHVRGFVRADPADDPCVDRYGVTPGYLTVLGIPLVAGRDFDETDTATARPVILVSQTTARAIWGDANPIGAQVRIGAADTGPWRTVIGVTGDVHHDDLTTPSAPAFYNPESQITSGYLTAVIRARGSAAAAAAPARSLLHELDPRIPVYAVTPLATLIDDSVAERLFVTRLLGGFAIIALLLAAVGLYGVVAYGVAQRTREVGVRVALGARRRDVMRLVLSSGLVLVLSGIGAGILASIAATRYLGTLVFGVSSTDLATFTAAALLLAVVALLAHWVPVRRALRIDPARALRAE